MSNHKNYKRNETHRTEHGPRWEYGGSNNSCVARARRRWQDHLRRSHRSKAKQQLRGGQDPDLNRKAFDW